MRIAAGGNVGIGTGTPRRRLDVAGEIVATNRLTLAQDAGSATRTWHLDNAGGRLRIFDQPNIDTSGTERLTITPEGNVGIGMAAARRRLDVQGEIVATNRLTLAQDAGSATRTWHLDNAAGRLRIFDQPNIDTPSTERLTITVEGNVGIGTATPLTATGGRALHVHNPSGPSALRLGHGGVGGQQWEWQSTVISNIGALNLSNLTSMINPFTVLANGNVGIGTVAPTVRCAVNGTLAIIGSIRDDQARQILGALPSPYSVIIAVEEIGQGTSLVFYGRMGLASGARGGWRGGYSESGADRCENGLRRAFTNCRRSSRPVRPGCSRPRWSWPACARPCCGSAARSRCYRR